MLNHVEIQGKIGGGTVRTENQTSFFIDHKRGFGDETERFLCTVKDLCEKTRSVHKLKEADDAD